MKNKIFIFIVGFLFSGCSYIFPYKTKFDCNKSPTGNCNGITQNIKQAYIMAGLTSSDNIDSEDLKRE